MTVSRFDTLARSLSGRLTRRTTLRALGAGLAAGAGIGGAPLRRAAAQDATPAPASPSQEFLFVQTFTAGTMAPHATDPELYTLTLTGHAAETIYFSDRPERIVGSLSTTTFLETLGFSPDNPPNAALVAGDQVVVIELFDPVYSETVADGGTVTLTYDVRVLADYTEEGLAHLARQASASPPETFGSASLFIDDCSDVTIQCVPFQSSDAIGDIGVHGRCWHWVAAPGPGCWPCEAHTDLQRQCTAKYGAERCNSVCQIEYSAPIV